MPFRNKLPFLVLLLFLSCGTEKKNALPFLGQFSLDTTLQNGSQKIDTIPYKIPPFELLNQDSQLVNNNKLKGKVYIADFFFSYCPDICVPMKKEMLRIHEGFKSEERLKLISHTLDPIHDSIPFLKAYAKSLDIDTRQWQFLNGPELEVYKLASEGYMGFAEKNKNAAGGIAHSGYFILVDGNGHIRGVYDGTNKEEVDVLMIDLQNLLDAEY